MKITRRFTKAGQDSLGTVQYERRTSRISNPDGTVVFEMTDAEIPVTWSQLATDIMVSKYFRKAGVPQTDASGKPVRDEQGKPVTGPEKSVKQVVNRLAGCWRWWGETHGYFDSAEDAQAFYDEIAYMLVHQMCAPNSPQWFNTGLNWAYGISGPSQGHYYCDPKTGELKEAEDAYSHPQPHACFIQSVNDDLVNSGGIMDLWVREARLFKYGSGTGSNFSSLRGENERLSGGGKSSGLMSFLKIGDRAAGAIKSGGTTRRAAKMVCLNLDHPDIEDFVNWKVREELKVAAMAEGLKALPRDQKLLAERLKLKLDYDFNGEAYATVSGQNSNNSVRIPNQFFHLVEQDGEWELTFRCNKKVAKKLKARDLWEQIAFAAWRCADPGVQFDDTINQWHTCPNSGRINASNPCVTGDTRVLTPGGIWRRIDGMIHLPARVVTNLEGQQIHATEGAFPTGMREVFELSTEGGYKLKLTANHKVWTRTRGWVEAKNLTVTDEIRLPSGPASFREIGEPLDPTFYQLIGMFCSESNDDLTALNLDRCMLEEREVDLFANYVEEQWGDKHYDDDYIDYALIGDPGSGSDTATATLTNGRLVARLQAYVKGSGTKRSLADEAFTAGLSAQKHILRGLFSADGDVVNGSIEIRALSMALLSDVQMLLLGFGVRSGIRPGLAIHTLRIHESSLQAFATHIGVMSDDMGKHLQAAARMARPADAGAGHWERVGGLMPIGTRQVFDLTEPVTNSFIANGITVHNCSEYMFLDDTACNLASFNVLRFFDSTTRTFDIEGYRHAIRLWTIVLEISVMMASFPSEEIAQLSYEYRTLGLGYANLGAMLMQAGIPYNSEKGRGICASLSSILTGESYATSAEMAKELGAFKGFAKNKGEMLRVIHNHRRAAYDVTTNAAAQKKLGDFEALEIKPIGIDATQFVESDTLASVKLLAAARDCWDQAVALGEKHGYRNAQTTVIAPTGTIGLLMDCDTTGVEPDFALVKFKKLAGGGYFKIANQSLKPALANLRYKPEQISAIVDYVMGTLLLDKSPNINRRSLVAAGLSEQEIAKAEAALPGTFELGFAFTPWTLGQDVMKRLKISESDWSAPGFNLLRKLGFTAQQISEANDVVCGSGTVEGAPHLKVEHYAVFECANRCGKHGRLFIPAEGHIRMMAAAQPFISGAISKTINLPTEATVEDIKSSYFLSWKLGLKANALYRDGSKLSQPLNVKSDEELDKSEEDDEENVAAAKEELAGDVVKAVNRMGAMARGGETEKAIKSDNLAPAHSNVVEKIVERIVERPLRRRLPDTRNAITHKFDVAGHEGYLTVGLYDDGMPGEVFITMAKEGSTIGGLMDTIATLVSVSLQYGVPVESLVRKFEHVRFEPSGMTRNPEIPFAKSLTDYIFRWLAMEFLPGYRTQHAPKRGGHGSGGEEKNDSEGVSSSGGNGHGTSVKSGGAAFAYTESEMRHAAKTPGGRLIGIAAGDLRLAPMADALSQQGSQMQSDAPACDVCGSITVRSGTCYKCLNCGNSMGCS